MSDSPMPRFSVPSEMASTGVAPVPARPRNWMPPPLSMIGAEEGKRLDTACTPVSLQRSTERDTVTLVAFWKVPRSIRVVAPPVSVTEPLRVCGELITIVLLPSRTKFRIPPPALLRLPAHVELLTVIPWSVAAWVALLLMIVPPCNGTALPLRRFPTAWVVPLRSSVAPLSTVKFWAKSVPLELPAVGGVE